VIDLIVPSGVDDAISIAFLALIFSVCGLAIALKKFSGGNAQAY
jgi:hypothetical protein